MTDKKDEVEINAKTQELSKDLSKLKSHESYKQYLTILPRNDGSSPGSVDDIFSFSTSKTVVHNPHFQTVPSDTTTPADNIYPDLSQPENQSMPPPVSVEEARKAELEQELAKTEEEIATLRQVLLAKEQHAAELKKELGITPLGQLKAELNKVQSSQAYKKTSETLKSAGHATAEAFNTFGSTMSTKFSEMKNSPTFKSFEEKVEGMGTSIMAKVSGTSREGSAGNTPTGDVPSKDPVTEQPHVTENPPI
ncbi:tumor protein D52-like isoform X2 [Clavelina lepadiformis]|uniref:tumor protein D52-like isoform X2 n=1 Tax=Clavelina lepadiformis TaxID=159417 RepID=UPI004042A257